MPSTSKLGRLEGGRGDDDAALLLEDRRHARDDLLRPARRLDREHVVVLVLEVARLVGPQARERVGHGGRLEPGRGHVHEVDHARHENLRDQIRRCPHPTTGPVPRGARRADFSCVDDVSRFRGGAHRGSRTRGSAVHEPPGTARRSGFRAARAGPAVVLRGRTVRARRRPEVRDPDHPCRRLPGHHPRLRAAAPRRPGPALAHRRDRRGHRARPRRDRGGDPVPERPEGRSGARQRSADGPPRRGLHDLHRPARPADGRRLPLGHPVRTARPDPGLEGAPCARVSRIRGRHRGDRRRAQRRLRRHLRDLRREPAAQRGRRTAPAFTPSRSARPRRRRRSCRRASCRSTPSGGARPWRRTSSTSS